jgi:ferredoxin--NADP+ reductase
LAKVIEKERLSDAVWRFRLHAPRIAKKRKAGQFVILRPVEGSERIPLTIAGADAAEGWIDIIFQVIGRTTTELRDIDEGDEVCDLAGPLGRPTHIENFGRALCIGGGVGVAPLYPIVCALFAAGNDVTTIVGARSCELIILEDEIKASSNRLFIATDNGSYGTKGFVSDVFNELMGVGENFDIAFVIGPVAMMKATTALTVAAGIKTYASLNPIMIDGTGMCGGCRVTVGGRTKFACVDGPEFDASQIAWDEMTARLNAYKSFETRVMENYHECKIG